MLGLYAGIAVWPISQNNVREVFRGSRETKSPRQARTVRILGK